MAKIPTRDGKRSRKRAAPGAASDRRRFKIRGRGGSEADIPGLDDMKIEVVKAGFPGAGQEKGEKLKIAVTVRSRGKTRHLIEMNWHRLSGNAGNMRWAILDAVAHRIMEEEMGSGWIRREDADRIVRKWADDPGWDETFEEIEDSIGLARILES